MRKPALTNNVIGSLLQLVEYAENNGCIDCNVGAEWVRKIAEWRKSKTEDGDWTYEAEARDHFKDGNRIAALKTIRTATGQSLIEAKVTLDRLTRF